MKILEEKCKGEKCRVCYSDFRCPALMQDPETGKSMILEDVCPGCGACVNVCPANAITKEKIAS